MGQTIACGAHRLSIGGGTTTTIAGNGGSPTNQSVPTPTPALANVGIELNEVQPGKFSTSSLKLCLILISKILPPLVLLCIGKKCVLSSNILIHIVWLTVSLYS